MSHREPSDDLLGQAALHALNAEEPAAAADLERHLAEGCAVCAGAVADFSAVVGRLGEAPPAAAPPPQLRQRVLEAVAASARLTIVRSDEGRWTPGAAAGSLVKRLLREPAAGRVTALVSMQPGAVYPSHQHADTEELYMLEGDLDVQGRPLGPGDYCAAVGGTVHRSAATTGGCRFIVRASEGDRMVEAAQPSPAGLHFVLASEGETGEGGDATTRALFTDASRGAETLVMRMRAGGRGRVSGRQIYVIEGAVRLASGEELRAGDFCGSASGIARVGDSDTGCTLLVLSATRAMVGS